MMCDGLEPRYACACLYVAQQMLFIFKSPTEVTYVQLVHHCYCSPFMSSADLSQHVSVCPAVSCLCSRHSTGRCISCALLQVRSRFRAEFVNRIDEFTVFNPLARADIKRIVKLQAKRVEERLTAKKMKMRLTDNPMEFLAVRDCILT